jgi:hypothetical protein
MTVLDVSAGNRSAADCADSPLSRALNQTSRPGQSRPDLTFDCDAVPRRRAEGLGLAQWPPERGSSEAPGAHLTHFVKRGLLSLKQSGASR